MSFRNRSPRAHKHTRPIAPAAREGPSAATRSSEISTCSFPLRKPVSRISGDLFTRYHVLDLMVAVFLREPYIRNALPAGIFQLVRNFFRGMEHFDIQVALTQRLTQRSNLRPTIF